MCAKSAKGRIHPGDAENQRRITKASVVLLPAPHVHEVGQGENTPSDAENQRRVTKASVVLLSNCACAGGGGGVKDTFNKVMVLDRRVKNYGLSGTRQCYIWSLVVINK